MAFVLVAGVGFGALRSATELWASALYSLAALCVGVAVLGCFFCRGRSRAFSVGFLTFVLGYLIALAFGEAVSTPLVTTRLLDAAYAIVHRDPSSRAVSLYQNLVSPSPGYEWKLVYVAGTGPSPGRFQGIGHTLTALVLGVLGGFTARFLAARNESTEPNRRE
jgi:hypothetical protein